jgi:triacylglycerol lipase
VRNPVVLVHGITDDGSKFDRLVPYLHQAGITTRTIDLVPNNGDAKLEILARQLADFIDRFYPDRPIDLVGFSMGGLVSRYYIQRLGGIDRVTRFITISSPHRGTIAAYFTSQPGCVQMRPGSDFLTDLDRDVHMLDRLQFTSIWTPFDLIILPPTSSKLGIGTEIELPILAHPLMVVDRRCIDALIRQLLVDRG